MPISSASTSTQVETTLSAVTKMLAKNGVRGITTSYDADGVPDGLSFILDTRWGPREYALPINAEGVQRALVRQKVSSSYRSLAHAKRVAWRHAHDWLKAQFNLIEAGAVEPAEVFFPYMVLAWNDTTPTTAFGHYASSQKAIES